MSQPVINFQRVLVTWSRLRPFGKDLTDREHTQKIADLHRLADRLAVEPGDDRAQRAVRGIVGAYGLNVVFDHPDWPVLIYNAARDMASDPWGIGGR